MATAGEGSRDDDGAGRRRARPEAGAASPPVTRAGVGKRVDKQEAALRDNLRRRKATARRRAGSAPQQGAGANAGERSGAPDAGDPGAGGDGGL